jgi:hypothetical protein
MLRRCEALILRPSGQLPLHLVFCAGGETAAAVDRDGPPGAAQELCEGQPEEAGALRSHGAVSTAEMAPAHDGAWVAELDGDCLNWPKAGRNGRPITLSRMGDDWSVRFPGALSLGLMVVFEPVGRPSLSGELGIGPAHVRFRFMGALAD